jgi:methyl-accepting chemotaxis protein
VIPEGVPQFARVASTLEEMSVVGRDTLVRFNTLLAERNQKAISSILGHLDDLGAQLRQDLPALRQDLHATLAATRQAAEQVQGLGRHAGQVLHHVDERLERVATETAATLASARQTLGTMEREVHGLALGLRLSADLATQEVQTTAQSLRLAGDALRDTGRAMSDPARILYGTNEADLGPGERP